MIPAEDRGFTLGDGLFETVLAVDGDLRLWDAHCARLARGCAVLGLPAPEEPTLKDAAEAALDAAGLAQGRAAVRLSWTAGAGGRGLDRPTAPAPALVVSAALAPQAGAPARLRTSTIRRNEGSPASRLKTLAYLDNVLARREAVAAGADEALLLNNRGEVACAGAANVFWIKEGILFTPELGCGVLDGVVRGLLVDRARRAGLEVETVRLGREALDAVDALFLTNSLVGVRPVATLDELKLPPHPAAERLVALVADVL